MVIQPTDDNTFVEEVVDALGRDNGKYCQNDAENKQRFDCPNEKTKEMIEFSNDRDLF